MKTSVGSPENINGELTLKEIQNKGQRKRVLDDCRETCIHTEAVFGWGNSQSGSQLHVCSCPMVRQLEDGIPQLSNTQIFVRIIFCNFIIL